tara:strand:+ start:221 stop:889 length:669 start_codon:yes stop_codon:yes gene_type:complete
MESQLPQLQPPYFVQALDKHKLNIDLIVSIMRPMLSAQSRQYYETKGGLPPQPLRVTVRVKETKTEATLVFEDDNGERTLTQVQTMTSYGRKQLTTNQMVLPLRKIRRELNDLLDYLSDEDFGPVASLPDPRPKGRPKGRRSAITDKKLLEIAEKYNALEGMSGAIRELASSEGYSENTISQYIRRAREAGFLEPTTAGKKNWNLTPKALRLLEETNEKGNK